MAIETLERPQTIRFRATIERRPTRRTPPSSFEPNFGPEDMHAIKAIAYIMNGIFIVALLMYGVFTLSTWLGS